MLPLADLFVHVYVLVDDAVQHGQVPIPDPTRPRPDLLRQRTAHPRRRAAPARPPQRACLAG